MSSTARAGGAMPGQQCSELEFISAESDELERAFKVPSLRNVADRMPYMHAGQIATLDDVVAHYNNAPAAPAGQTELKPLQLNATEIRQLTAFLRTLSGGTAAPPELLRARESTERFISHHPERGGWTGVSVRISNYENHGMCHDPRILRFLRFTPTHPTSLGMTEGLHGFPQEQSRHP